MGKKVEIYLKDLSKEKQDEILEKFGDAGDFSFQNAPNAKIHRFCFFSLRQVNPVFLYFTALSQ